MAAVRRVARYRGIHEETSTGTTDNISTAKPIGSHQSTARIPPISASGIPQNRKLDRPLFIGQAPLFALLDYSPHLIIEQGFCPFASCCTHPTSQRSEISISIIFAMSAQWSEFAGCCSHREACGSNRKAVPMRVAEILPLRTVRRIVSTFTPMKAASSLTDRSNVFVHPP